MGKTRDMQRELPRVTYRFAITDHVGRCKGTRKRQKGHLTTWNRNVPLLRVRL